MEIRKTFNRVAPVVLVASLGLAACGGDGTELEKGAGNAPTTTEVFNPEDAQRAEELCPEGFGNTMPISEEFSLDRVGGYNSLLPSFSETDSEGKVILASASEVAKTTLERACEEPTLAATLDALFIQSAGINENGTYKLPDAGLTDMIQQRTELFRSNKEEMLNAVANIASVITPDTDNGMEYVENFNAIANQAKIISPIRGEDDNAEQIGPVDVTSTDVLDGFQIRFNYDRAVNQGQLETMKDIEGFVLIRPDGSIIVKTWIGPETGTNFDKEGQGAVDTSTTSTTSTTEANSPGTPEPSPDPNTSEPSPESPEPVTNPDDGSGSDDQAGPDDGGEDDNGCDSDENPSCEGGDQPGNPTPEPAATTTTQPAATTTTQPAATTTTQAPKGEVDGEVCNSNPYDAIPDCDTSSNGLGGEGLGLGAAAGMAAIVAATRRRKLIDEAVNSALER